MSEKHTQAAGLYEFNGKAPFGQIATMGAQHLLAAIIGVVIPGRVVATAAGMQPMDIATVIQMCIIVSGVATLIQVLLGSKLPVVMGTSFGYVPVLTSIVVYANALTGGDPNPDAFAILMGAILVGSIAYFLVGIFMKHVRRFFPAIVTGTIIFSIGVSLLPVAIRYFAGGGGSPHFGEPQTLLVGFVTFLVVFILTNFAKGMLSLGSILIAVIVGFLLSLAFGMVDFTTVQEAPIMAVPVPLRWGLQFRLVPILTMLIMCTANSMQSVGDLTAITSMMDRKPTDKELSGGVLSNFVSTILCAIFGSLPTATFSQNTGLVLTTKAINKGIFIFAAGVMILAGLFPPISAFLGAIPSAVIGGAIVGIFAAISVTGMRLIASQGFSKRNMQVVGTAIAFGLGIPMVAANGATHPLQGLPDQFVTVFGNSMVIITTILVVALNLILKEEKEETVVKQETARIEEKEVAVSK